MEHRHDWQDAVERRNAHGVDECLAVGMQYRRPVAIQRAFRMTRGAGRVAQARGGIFIEQRPFVRIGFIGDQFFVA